jgi:hypothetical protein
VVARLGQKRANGIGLVLTGVGVLGLPVGDYFIPAHTLQLWSCIVITVLVFGAGYMLINSILASFISLHASSEMQVRYYERDETTKQTPNPTPNGPQRPPKKSTQRTHRPLTIHQTLPPPPNNNIEQGIAQGVATFCSQVLSGLGPMAFGALNNALGAPIPVFLCLTFGYLIAFLALVRVPREVLEKSGKESKDVGNDD